MTNATITSIAKHTRYKGPYARKSNSKTDAAAAKQPPESCCQNKFQRDAAPLSSGDRYQASQGHDAHLEARNHRQNEIALAARDKDQTMRQISRRLDQMKNALNDVVHHTPPYPQGSHARMAALKDVGTLRMQIQQLTFPHTEAHNDIPAGNETNNAFAGITDDGTFSRWLPELTEHADDRDIASSIELLHKADDFIRTRRRDLRSETAARFQGPDTVDSASVEFTSLLIGKHLSHHPDTDLTTAPGILKEYLN